MIKYVLSLFILLAAASAFGQKKSIVTLIRSNSSTGIKLNGKDVIKVYKGTFKQDYSTLTSDSAYFYPQDNACDAFGHVDINQGDTLNIYSDLLNYNGNTKIAILTNNVKMVDKDATLTTNHFTYNTATRIGIYTDGGKLVNKDNTLLSKNGYYFAFTRDSYFRYNVSLTTPDALIKTDTMRYNTGTKISYFYGPTNIYGTKGEKDKDTLYTENGYYNTVVEQAAFGKNNLYRSGSKSLKGDSLFYDKIKGYGRAVKHVTFTDKEQKTTIKGNLGTYFKPEERTIVTQDPYVIMVTEQKDTTKTDSTRKKEITTAAAKQGDKADNGKNKINMSQLIKQTIPGAKPDPLLGKENMAKADTLVKQLQRIKPDSLTSKQGRAKVDSALKKMPALKPGDKAQIDSALKKIPAQNAVNKAMADQALKNLPLQTPADKQAAATAIKNAANNAKGKLPVKTDNKPRPATIVTPLKDTSRMKYDTIYFSADTIETQILTYKNLKIYQEKQRLAHMRDTSAKPKKPVKESKFLTATYAGVSKDTTYMNRNFFGKPKPIVVKRKPAKPLTKQQLLRDSLAKKQVADSIIMAKKLEPADTARIRIMMMYHHAKLFKSDLQSKADSMFYSNADSTIRCYVNPIIWTQGSQLTGDTIHLQMKHKKLDNMTMFPNAFIVNLDKADSTHFNQVAGKRMRGYFKDDKLNRMDIIGNAESIYFSRDSVKNTVTGMERSLSSRIRVDFENNNATTLSFYTKPAHTYGPLKKFKEDERILKGFIWKPKERPISKESIIPSYNKPKNTAKAGSDKGKAGKAVKAPPGKLPAGIKAVKDSVGTPALKTPGLRTGKDSTVKINPPVKIGKDSVRWSPVKIGKDSVIKVPGRKVGKDSVGVKPTGIK